jgi:hypothetical protein
LSDITLVLKRAVVLVGLSALGAGVYSWLVRDAGTTRTRNKREGGQPVRVLVVAEHAGAGGIDFPFAAFPSNCYCDEPVCGRPSNYNPIYGR